MTNKELAVKLVDLIQNEVWVSIRPHAWDDTGLDITIYEDQLVQKIEQLLDDCIL